MANQLQDGSENETSKGRLPWTELDPLIGLCAIIGYAVYRIWF
jgi:hypothetical protein